MRKIFQQNILVTTCVALLGSVMCDTPTLSAQYYYPPPPGYRPERGPGPSPTPYSSTNGSSCDGGGCSPCLSFCTFLAVGLVGGIAGAIAGAASSGHGKRGRRGCPGEQGPPGQDGVDGSDGAPGAPGAPGASAGGSGCGDCCTLKLDELTAVTNETNNAIPSQAAIISTTVSASAALVGKTLVVEVIGPNQVGTTEGTFGVNSRPQATVGGETFNAQSSVLKFCVPILTVGDITIDVFEGQVSPAAFYGVNPPPQQTNTGAVYRLNIYLME